MNDTDAFERWLVLRSGPGPSAWNMALDEVLLEEAASLDIPLLRFYGWSEPAATFGYFQKYAEISSWTHLRPLVRRPTGGGLVPHDNDWTYSLIVPPFHAWHQLRAEESYERAHSWVAGSFERLSQPATLATSASKEAIGQCFIGAEKLDVLVRGKKIAGAAQRRNKKGLLIQGSVHSPQPDIARAAWESAFLLEGRERLKIQWSEFTLPAKLKAMATEAAENKYSRREYNEKR